MTWMYVVFCILLLFVLYMVKEAHENNIRTHTVQATGNEDQFAVFFISDVHNRRMSTHMLQQIKSVEAVIIGGDFADKRVPLKQIKENLQKLRKLGPIYFIWGNNDREVGEEQFRALLAQYDVTVVENDAVLLPNRANSTWISAIDDTSTRAYSFEKALEKCQDGDITLFVSHNPQVFYKAYPLHKPTLMMGGHLHGGQIRLGSFGVHPHGSFSIRKGVPTLVSNGYGTTLMPLRLMAKPECHIITITCQKADCI
ncbi:metallophosphoesterase [Lysinibacillus sp. LZ02]|uniref:metallophosphoesterase n=1 Tax=Lysinibacillus sp. LZ02 TaxID=3420668 RepID=UPI003D35D374